MYVCTNRTQFSWPLLRQALHKANSQAARMVVLMYITSLLSASLSYDSMWGNWLEVGLVCSDVVSLAWAKQLGASRHRTNSAHLNLFIETIFSKVQENDQICKTLRLYCTCTSSCWQVLFAIPGTSKTNKPSRQSNRPQTGMEMNDSRGLPTTITTTPFFWRLYVSYRLLSCSSQLPK